MNPRVLAESVAGLVAEAETIDALDELATLIPELLQANGMPLDGQIAIELLARRVRRTPRLSACSVVCQQRES
jgi:hypothetical protein